MKPLRVCINAQLIGGVSGGIDQMVIGLAHGLSSLRDGDEEFLFLAYSDECDWIEPYLSGPCRLHQTGPAPRKRHRGKRRFPALKRIDDAVSEAFRCLRPLFGGERVRIARSDGVVERLEANVVHFPFQDAFLTEIPSIYHPHDLQHRHLPQYFKARERLKRDAKFTTFGHQARIVAAGSTWVREDLILSYGFPEEKVRVVPLAPVLNAYPNPSDEDLAAAREKFALPPRFAFYPAQTWPHKNHIGLLEALALLRDRHRLRVPLVCSGRQTDFYSEIEKCVLRHDLGDQVRFLGFVSPLEIQCLYRLCDCVVIPTQFEAGSFPLWEAFLAGVPAACSNVTSLPEQAADVAMLFDPNDGNALADTILRLWMSEALRQELALRGMERVRAFSWEKTARIFRALYRQIGGGELSDEDRFLMAEPALM